jgi:hypothetical protein
MKKLLKDFAYDAAQTFILCYVLILIGLAFLSPLILFVWWLLQ